MITEIIQQINNIYVDNFPPSLRVSSNDFKKSLNDYDYIDILYDPAAPHDDKVVGFGLLNLYPTQKLLHLDYLALDKSFQGNGNGSKYLKSIVEKYYLLNNKIKYMILECEPRLVPFYRKNNWFQLKCNYTYDGSGLELMVYGLNPKFSMHKKIAQFLMEQFLSHDGIPLHINIYLVFNYILWTIYLMNHLVDLVLNSIYKSVYI